jgi:hypothetical protein
MARFKLQGRTYNTAALDEISLKDLLVFNSQAEDMGLRRNWADVERVSEELAQLDPVKADQHPERFLVISTTIWAARRIAGDVVTLDEAVSFPLREIEFLPEPGDRKPGKPKGAKKAPAKSARTSGRVSEPLPSTESSSTSTGSEMTSTTV